MRDLFHDDDGREDWKARARRFLLDLDSRVDSGIYLARTWGRELYERYTVFIDRFHVAGWRRWYFVEPLSEGATLGLGGLIMMLALAIPALRETSDDDWLKKSELAVTFLDRFGNEIGSRGIRHNDAIPLQDFPDHLIKAVLATEDRRFYEHFGIDIPGTFRAIATNARAGGVVQGGSSHHPAIGQEPVPLERAHHRAQGQGGVPGAVARSAAAPRTRFSSSISTAPIWAAARSASTPRRSTTSTSPRAT